MHSAGPRPFCLCPVCCATESHCCQSCSHSCFLPPFAFAPGARIKTISFCFVLRIFLSTLGMCFSPMFSLSVLWTSTFIFLSQEIPVLGRDRNDFQEDSYSPSPPRNERTALRLPFPPLRSAVGGQGYLSRSAFSPWIVVPKHILASRKVVKSSCIFIKWFNMTSFTQGGYHSVPVDLPKNQLKSLLSAVHTPSVGTQGQSKMYCVCHLCGVLTLSFLLCYLYFLMGSQWYRGWGIRYPILPHVRHSFSCALAKRFLHS